METTKEFVTFQEVYEAYLECRQRKRNTPSALEFELEYEINLFRLWKRLNQGKFVAGRSIAFCVTKPKLREVFAAPFVERIVHHLLVRKFFSVFERHFHPDAYNCRVGKGVLYGVQRIAEQAGMMGKDGWFLKLDLKGFFMSIDKDILYGLLEDLIFRNYHGDDSWWWLALWRSIIYNRPEKDCIIRGDPRLWDDLPWDKSLFKTNGKGLPIGNLTSQVLANLLLTGIDKRYSSLVQGYGRYVDDMILLDTDKGKLKRVAKGIHRDLSSLGLRLNPRKTILQRVDKGIPFIGYIIQPYGLYPGKRLRTSSLEVSRDTSDPLGRYITRMNSYLGFLGKTLSGKLRMELCWNAFQSGRDIVPINEFKIFKNPNKEMKLFNTVKKSDFAYRIDRPHYTIIRWNPVELQDGESYLVEEDTMTGTVTLPRVRALIEGDINKDTDERILNGFTWTPVNGEQQDGGYSVYLSTENQFNFKAAYDLAVQTEGASLPVRFKFSKGGAAVYHEFTTVPELTDFYTKSVAHINQCLNDGWDKKDAVDYSKYV